MAQEEPIAAGDDVILSGGEQNISPDQQAEGDAFNESGEQDSPDINDEQAPQQNLQLDAEQEYAQMDYRICGELSK